MTEKLQQTIKEELEKLPKENQEAIGMLDWVGITETIGKKNLLTEDEINNLQVETMVVLFGLEDPEIYAVNIEDEVGTSREEAEKIATEITEKVFTPINDKLLDGLKKSSSFKNPKWDQNVDFILSNGDYSSFLEGKELVDDTTQTNIPVKVPVKPGRVTDIKSKFVI